jgi:hypothetical protein
VGEAEFGLIDGVLSTTAGWIGKVEVVEVEFDPRRVAYADLLAHAVDRDCALRVFPRSDAQLELARAKVGDAAERTDAKLRLVEDQKYYLGRTALRFVPMTRVQATRISADLENAANYLSPRQQRIWAAAQSDSTGFVNCIDRAPIEAWDEAWQRTIAREH